jgi:hypothetical protein
MNKVVFIVCFALSCVHLLLRYVRRLHLVEQGAKEATAGSQETPVIATVTGALSFNTFILTEFMVLS